MALLPQSHWPRYTDSLGVPSTDSTLLPSPSLLSQHRKTFTFLPVLPQVMDVSPIRTRTGLPMRGSQTADVSQLRGPC